MPLEQALNEGSPLWYKIESYKFNFRNINPIYMKRRICRNGVPITNLGLRNSNGRTSTTERPPTLRFVPRASSRNGRGGTSDRGVRGGLRGDGRSYGRLQAVRIFDLCPLCVKSSLLPKCVRVLHIVEIGDGSHLSY